MAFKVRRVYEPPLRTDGIRVLVDRLWPRGLKKAAAAIEYWLKDVAPSPALRVWFDHDPEKFTAFAARYRAQLKGNPALSKLRSLGRAKTVTLLYGARDPHINHAVVLKAALSARPLAKKRATPPRSAR